MNPITLLTLVGQYAPEVINALGGHHDIEKVATVANKVLADVTGKTDQTKAQKLLETDPDLAFEFEKQMNERAVKELGLVLKDVQDARKTWSNHWMPIVLTLVMVVIMLGATAANVWIHLFSPDSVHNLVAGTLGALLATATERVKSAWGFWFGQTDKFNKEN